jgi:hypothetical protein
MANAGSEPKRQELAQTKSEPSRAAEKLPPPSSLEPPPPFRPDALPGSLKGDSDAFGHMDYATAVTSIVLDAEPPFTLGLFGPWGLGKTTIIEEVGSQLRGKAAFVYFDAWRYEGDALRRQFLRDLAKQLHKDEADFDPEKQLKDLEESRSWKDDRFSGFRGTSLLEAGIRAVIAGVFVLVLLRAVGATALRDQHGTLRDSVISAAVALILFAITPLTQMVRVTEETVTRSRLEDPEHFTAKFEDLLRALKKDRLVVAIDNLDRCTPKRVEEILSTIKTYLEPAAQHTKPTLVRRLFRSGTTKDAVFIIAADDRALRRHLEAQEAHASSGTPKKLVSQYVDEYLRKFFTATVRIHPLLDQDMRQYVEKQLEDVSARHHFQPETRRPLIEMVAAALSRNPRRVRQFANNLEARLRVIEQRELEARIAPPISDQPLVIAKLAILEEEWPTTYSLLLENPRLLDDWHTQILQGQGPSVAGVDADDPLLRRFLSISRDIRTSNLSAFLRLKQSQEEIDIPRYAEFRDAIALGNIDEVSAIVDQEADKGGRFAQQLPSILDEELGRSFYDGARSVVEAAISIPALAAHENIRGEVLRRAVADAELRRRLRSVRPKPLLQATRSIRAVDRDLIIAEFLDLRSFAAESATRLQQVTEGLAEITNSHRRATSIHLSRAPTAGGFPACSGARATRRG